MSDDQSAHASTSFERLLGRQPSEKEIKNLHRVKSALGLQDNDALWLVIMALESYDTLFQRYPALISQQVESVLESQRSGMAAIAEVETKRALGALTEAVNRSSEAIASRIAEASRLQSWGWAFIGFVTFGCFCITVGFVLGSGALPYWAPQPDPAKISFIGLIVRTVARTPAGWLVGLGGMGFATLAVWRARDELLAGRRLVMGAGLMALFCLSALAASGTWIS